MCAIQPPSTYIYIFHDAFQAQKGAKIVENGETYEPSGKNH